MIPQDDSTISQEMTRILIKALPKLIAKHQSDVPRLADILSIPHLMTLEMYLDLRMVTVSLDPPHRASKRYL